jgi:hypothetical protein
VRKSTQEVLEKAAAIKEPLVEFFQKQLGDFGDEVDQLRVLGHAAQALVDLAQSELDEIKLQEEVANPKSRILLPN